MKTFLILYPSKFTEHDVYKFETSYLEKKKNYEVIIHDLSNISFNKQFNDTWKTKRSKKAIVFTSLISWVREFNKIRKKKNILIYDFMEYSQANFKILVIELLLKLSKLPILKNEITFFAHYRPKKNFKFYLNRILFRHKLNLVLSKINIYWEHFWDKMKIVV